MAITELDLGKYQLGWSDVEDYVFKPRKGCPKRSSGDVCHEGERAGCSTSVVVAAPLRAQADGALVRREDADLDFDDIYTTSSQPTRRSATGPAAESVKTPGTGSVSRSRAQVLAE